MVDRRFQRGMAWRMLFAFLLFSAIGNFLVFAPSMFGLPLGADLEELESAARDFLIRNRRIWPAVLWSIAPEGEPAQDNADKARI
jgi:hypothetical protein